MKGLARCADPEGMNRRSWINWWAGLGGGAAAEAAPAAGSRADRMALPDVEWRQRLGVRAHAVLRHADTERPFSSPLNAEHRPGHYHCAGCDLPLFSHSTKFDSGTGWPSFYDALPGALQMRSDHALFLPRTEHHCARCGGHQGHVFDDGPQPTGKRFCNNGVALRFVPAEA